MTNQKILHSCPSWIAGPRSAHPKFGGGVVIGGIERVQERLFAIKERFPEDLSSGHLWHEVVGGGFGISEFNNPNAIDWEVLKEGIREDCYPEWSAMTAPAFGLKGVENGAILSEDPARRELAAKAHITAIAWSQNLKYEGKGKGYAIWWPAFDSSLHRGPLSKLDREEGRERLITWWADTLTKALEDDEIPGFCNGQSPLMWFEYKPSVPGELDLFPTMEAAIYFCQAVNDRLGFKAMVINLEFAHALIGGQSVSSAVSRQISAGLFHGLVHVNSAELATVLWNMAGTEIIEGTPGDDADWPVGEGRPDNWADQREAIRMLVATGQDIVFEHDIDPAGEDPMECYARSRTNLEKMLAE